MVVEVTNQERFVMESDRQTDTHAHTHTDNHLLKGKTNGIQDKHKDRQKAGNRMKEGMANRLLNHR